MGNSNSTGLFVQTDKPVYSPGEMVTGTVFINILNPVKASTLTLRIKGKEKTHWTEQRTRHVQDRTETYTETFYGEHQMFNVIIPVASFDRNLPFSGQYQYPFSFILPEGIPGSTSVAFGNATGRIYYKVKAVLEVVGTFKSDLKFRQPIYIRQLPPFIGRLQSTYSSPVKVFCCFSKGFVNFSVTADKNSYTGGEVATIISSIENQSSKPFKRLIAELVQVIELTARNGYRETHRTMAKNVYPGIEPMTTDMARQMALALPPDLQQNALGYLVRVYYTLNVRADLSWGSDPTCAMPVIIYESDLVMMAANPMVQVVAPPGYQPIMQQAVVVPAPGGFAPPAAFTLSNFFNVQPISPVICPGSAPQQMQPNGVVQTY